MSVNESILVVYDLGSASPLQLAAASKELRVELTFVLPDSEHNRKFRTLLEQIGRCYSLTELSDGQVSELEGYTAPEAILTFSEQHLTLTAALAARFGIDHTALDDMPAIVRKEQQRLKLSEAGITCPSSALVRSPEELERACEALRLPVIVKPSVGAGSRDTVLIQSVPEMKRFASQLFDRTPTNRDSGLLVEQLLVGRPVESPWGDYLGLDVAVYHNTMSVVCTMGKFGLAYPFREKGGYSPIGGVSLSEMKEVHNLAFAACGALNIVNSVACVEVKLTTEGPRVIEVNGRLGAWGAEALMRSHQFDVLGTIFERALRRPTVEFLDATAKQHSVTYVENPPAWARWISEIDVHALLAIQGVDRVSLRRKEGDDVDYLAGYNSAVATIYAHCQSLNEVKRTVNWIESSGWVKYC